MERALVLARRGAGNTSPNPLVGAIIARDGRVLGEGWHRRYGGKHAEAEALDAVCATGQSLAGADLYCTLEPCCFTGPLKRQPPCTQGIITSGIRRVVIANQDPHPAVNGKGIRVLREAGIIVQTGLLSAAGEKLNQDFFTFHRRNRPFVHLKIAQTLDGRIAAPGGDARWITDTAARRLVHRLRSHYDAVLVGRGTVLADDPELTVRLVKGRNPLRVVLDSRLSLPDTAKLLSLPDREKTLIICSGEHPRIQNLRDCGVGVLPLENGVPGAGLPLGAVLTALGERGVRSILVEGGGSIFSAFLRAGLWDRISVFIAPMILGDGINGVSGLAPASIGDALELEDVSTRRIGNQLLFEGSHVYRNC
jgi:diaminohydroxyphosphoribosylaminopyrimidine deaminase/5-amino-6-(5-phosphoribosylamino)uracil reductase